MNEDLVKYEAELVALNKELTRLDEAKTEILRRGFRIEGIVAYLRAKKQGEKKEEAPVTEEAAA